MPVPSQITDLSETISVNSPADSDTVGPSANNYLQSLSAFIRQIYDGAIKPLSALNFNGQKITSLGLGTVGSASSDALNAAQIVLLAAKVGEVRMWTGSASQAAVTAAWGPGWFICNGANGTVNLMDRFIVPAGGSYGSGATGGNNTVALSQYHLPTHSHGVNENPHSHSVADGGHSHVLNDPGHIHSVIVNMDIPSSPGGNNSIAANHGISPTGSVVATAGINSTGCSVATSGVGIGIYANSTNISIQNAGSGGAFDIRPPYFALAFVQYTGAGV